MKLLRIFMLVVSWLSQNVYCDELQTVDDAEFVKLIKEEHYVVALFCPSSSLERCEEFEGELASIREDLIDVMDGDGWVVKLTDSVLVEDFAVGMKDQPVTVMFRNGLPVIYDGPANEEVMLDSLVRYKEPGVVELTDNTFEHQTQAATGATTGDWLVMFFSNNCQLCHRLTAAMETVACKHRGRMNVARINKETYGEKTGRRFELGLEEKPDIIFFRLGKMYQYKAEKFDPESLSNFMLKGYADLEPESIPAPKSPLSDLVQLCLDYLVAYPILVCGCLSLPVLLLVAFMFLMKGEDEPKSKKSKKKKKEEQREKKESKKEK